MAKERFEDLYTLLEEKARRLEQGNLPLEDALKLYEEGAELVHRLRKLLGEAELRVEKVQSSLAEDEAQLREVEGHGAGRGRLTRRLLRKHLHMGRRRVRRGRICEGHAPQGWREFLGS